MRRNAVYLNLLRLKFRNCIISLKNIGLAMDLHGQIPYPHNPVKHGLVRRVSEWPWSSFARAVERGWYPADWGATEPSGIAGMDLE